MPHWSAICLRDFDRPSPELRGRTAMASQLAEIGVMLLMFGVGLHFSVDDLLSVRRLPAGRVVQIACNIDGNGGRDGVGLEPDGRIVFGLSLSVASTWYC